MYSVDERTGVILPLSPASVASGNLGTFLTMDPSRNFAFVDDVGTNVYTYAMNQLTGNLTQTAVTANGPNSNPFVVENNSRFAYGTSNGSTTINIYSYNASTGAVSLINTATNGAATATQSTIMDPQGRYLYTSNQTSNDVSQFAINTSTGALTSLGTAVSATQPGGICNDSQSRWLYATNTGGASVAGFSIQSNGSLVSISGSPFATPATGTSCAVTPDGAFLVIASTGLTVFPINQSTGALGTQTTYTAAANGVAISPSGQFVFSTDATTTRAFRMNKTTGALTLINTQPAGTGPSLSVLVNLYVF